MTAPLDSTLAGSTSLELESILAGPTIIERLEQMSSQHPARAYAIRGDMTVTLADLWSRVSSAVRALRDAGVTGTSRVAVSSTTTIDHVVTIFALLALDALWIPLNVQAKGKPLDDLLSDSGTTHLVAQVGSDIATAVSQMQMRDGGPTLNRSVLLSDVADTPRPLMLWEWHRTPEHEVVGDTCALMYTSGTTGRPKGVRVSERMLLASAVGTLHVSEAQATDVLYLWEPLYHIGGAQVIFVPLLTPATLALRERFSASSFWQDVVLSGATHVHYLGGILEILLRQPWSSLERAHNVRVFWGAGASTAVWQESARRFGVQLHECYGMTETSSFASVNKVGPQSGVGRPVPWFEVKLGSCESTTGVPAQFGTAGELMIRERVPGTITPGYFGDPDYLWRSGDKGWFRTGDLGSIDEVDNIHFHGRINDTIRVRGENVSAWQVDSVFSAHPDIRQCAAVGVEADIGEQEILLLVVPSDGALVDAQALVNWAAEKLPKYQLPRYVQLVDELPVTPSQRIAKGRLGEVVNHAAFVDVRSSE